MGCISAALFHEEDVKTHVDGVTTVSECKNPKQADITIAEAGNYDLTYTSMYSQIKIDFNWFYSTVSESVIKNLKKETNDQEKLNIIDIGCGDGNMSRLIMDNASYLSKKQIDILGIDISNAQIELAKSKLVSNIKYEVGSAENINIKYDNKFDVAIALWPFGYANTTEILTKMMSSCYGSLKNGGICIGATVTMPNPDLLSKYSDLHKRFDMTFDFKTPGSAESAESAQITDGTKLLHVLRGLPFDEYFYFPNTYDKIAKEIGFEDGIEFIELKDWTKDNAKLNDRELKIAEEFFGNPNPCRLFILRK